MFVLRFFPLSKPNDVVLQQEYQQFCVQSLFEPRLLVSAFDATPVDVNESVLVSNSCLWKRYLAFAINTSIFKTLLYFLSDCLSNWRRKCIADHPASQCFLFAKCPCVGKFLKPCHHLAGQARHSFEIRSRCLICDSSSIYTKLCPSTSRSGRFQIRTSMLL